MPCSRRLRILDLALRICLVCSPVSSMRLFSFLALAFFSAASCFRRSFFLFFFSCLLGPSGAALASSPSSLSASPGSGGRPAAARPARCAISFFWRSVWNQERAGRECISLEWSIMFCVLFASISAFLSSRSYLSSEMTCATSSSAASNLDCHCTTDAAGTRRWHTLALVRLTTSRSKFLSLSSTKVTATPAAPARAVRPILCKYVSKVRGVS
mmetsp:Transcript_9259/g.23464  ORF Transcript_9259/g.23464 Transcript_9259/m.23464 type:complete len:213 (-) Transcript_9259:44-682(-)